LPRGPAHKSLEPICYRATIESNTTIGNSCEISVRLGDTLLRILAGPEDNAKLGSCRVDIDPGSIQIWDIE